MTSPDPFTALGLPARPDLTDEQVRAAWRTIAAATHPDRPGGGDPARVCRRVRRLRGAAHPVGTVRGIRRPDRRPAAAGRVRHARPRARPRLGRWRALLLVPARIRHGRPLPAGRCASSPPWCWPWSPRSRGRAARLRPGSLPGWRVLAGADRAGGPRPAPGTVTPMAGDARMGGRGGRFFTGTWHGPGPSERGARPSSSGRPDRTASPEPGYGPPLSQPMQGHRPNNHRPLPTGTWPGKPAPGKADKNGFT